MTEILRFEMNVPAEVALKHAGPGKPIEGRYGNRVMYTLADDRVMYVAPIVASRITDLGIQPGERFQVRKQLKRQGSLRLIEWEVQRVVSEQETHLERELRESITVAQTTKTLQPSEVNEESNPLRSPAMREQVAPLTNQASATTPQSNGSGTADAPPAQQNENGSSLSQIQERAASSAPALTPVVPAANGSANGTPSSAQRNSNYPPVTTKLEHALKTAISAAYNAEKFSAELGYVVRFDADAIKSMAITVLINMSEGNRR